MDGSHLIPRGSTDELEPTDELEATGDLGPTANSKLNDGPEAARELEATATGLPPKYSGCLLSMCGFMPFVL